MRLADVAVRAGRGAVALVGLFAVTACVAEQPLVVHEAAPPPDTNVYFYPAREPVSAEQQDRDKYECNGWAVEKSGFDPSLPSVPPHQRVRVVAGGPPPGVATAAGAATGAVVGAAVANPWHAGEGAVLGAIAGAAIGGIADAERSAEADRMGAQAEANSDHARTAALERNALDFRRAMTACLEGRGYSVR